jgi:FtsZ-binding cell division protein ZapB
MALQHEYQALRTRATSVEKELADTNHAKDQLAEENRELHKQTLLYKQRIEKLEGVKRAVLTSLQDDESQWEYRARGSMMGGIPSMSSVPPVTPDQRVSIELPSMDPNVSEEQEGTPTEEEGEGMNQGKEYFQKARMALPFDAFHEFLKHIKNLNNDTISKMECLAEAKLIFGDTYHHLYVDLIQLLERHDSQGGSLL